MAKLMFSILLMILSTIAKATTINDSLVQGLSCKNLSVRSVYHAIRDDAFDETRNLPAKNWGFKSGIASIAGCWALARTQRMVSYLARYNTSSDLRSEKRVSIVLDMIRRARLTPDEQRLKNYSVFAVEDSNFSENKSNAGWNLWNALEIGYYQNVAGKKVLRSFREEIQTLQNNTFYRVKNLKMIWKNGDRIKSTNRETAQRLIQNLNGKRLTLLNLRVSVNTQHVIMAKSYRKTATDLYEFKIYDSNQPQSDSILYYNPHRHVFFAPDVVEKFKHEKTFRNLGVFIVDEQDRTQFESAMLNHYRELCKK